MRSRKLLQCVALPLAAMCLAPLVCLAQGSQSNTYGVAVVTVKPGTAAKFEQGTKELIAYERSHGDAVNADAFRVLDGPNAGKFAFLFPFRWADADHPPSYQADVNRERDKDTGAYVASVQLSFVDLLPNLGNPPPANSTPMKYYGLYHFTIKPGMMGDYLAALRQLTAAELKDNPGPTPILVYADRSGGDADAITVAVGHPSLADFARPGKSQLEALTEAYGDAQAVAIYRALRTSVASVGTDILVYQPDMSISSGQGQ